MCASPGTVCLTRRLWAPRVARLDAGTDRGGRPRSVSFPAPLPAMRRWPTIAAAAGLAATAAACGTRPPDLLVLTRSGSVPGAGLRLLVRDDGGVRCNRGAARPLPDPQLLDAGEIVRELAGPASRHLALPAGRGSVLHYRIRLEEG